MLSVTHTLHVHSNITLASEFDGVYSVDSMRLIVSLLEDDLKTDWTFFSCFIRWDGAIVSWRIRQIQNMLVKLLADLRKKENVLRKIRMVLNVRDAVLNDFKFYRQNSNFWSTSEFYIFSHFSSLISK